MPNRCAWLPPSRLARSVTAAQQLATEGIRHGPARLRRSQRPAQPGAEGRHQQQPAAPAQRADPPPARTGWRGLAVRRRRATAGHRPRCQQRLRPPPARPAVHGPTRPRLGRDAPDGGLAVRANDPDLLYDPAVAAYHARTRTAYAALRRPARPRKRQKPAPCTLRAWPSSRPAWAAMPPAASSTNCAPAALRPETNYCHRRPCEQLARQLLAAHDDRPVHAAAGAGAAGLSPVGGSRPIRRRPIPRPYPPSAQQAPHGWPSQQVPNASSYRLPGGPFLRHCRCRLAVASSTSAVVLLDVVIVPPRRTATTPSASTCSTACSCSFGNWRARPRCRASSTASTATWSAPSPTRPRAVTRMINLPAITYYTEHRQRAGPSQRRWHGPVQVPHGGRPRPSSRAPMSSAAISTGQGGSVQVKKPA